MDWSGIHGMSGCRANLDITRLLKEGRITQSEFERLITFSKVGLKPIVFNVVIAFSLIWICLYLESKAFSDVLPVMSFLFAPPLILLGLLSAKRCVAKRGFMVGIIMIFIGLLLVQLLVGLSYSA